jgi:DNA-binding CsgD family transcriptional regulator
MVESDDSGFEVLVLTHQHKTIAETASQLFVSVTTIKSHRSQIKEKLNAPSLPLACILANKLRLFELLYV